MVRFIEHIDLTPYNTFGITVKADLLFEFTESSELGIYLENKGLPERFLIIGSGSNLLFTEDYQGLIIYPNIPGLSVVDEDRNSVFLEAGAGENWDDVVDYAVKFDWGGIENLSGIPGKAGSSAVQNIGAYGVEVKDVIFKVKGIDLTNGKPVEFTNEECRFGYRDSVFKNGLKNRIVITSVIFKLEKFPEFNLSYGSLKDDVEKAGEVSLRAIRNVVKQIRDSKLPDVHLLGNAGSFFKNPVIGKAKADEMLALYETIPFYESSEKGMIKLAAGWLIDQCGWKGYREGDAGVHHKQALVLVNHGQATGKDILHLSEKIQKSVYNKFGITLEPEVNIIY